MMYGYGYDYGFYPLHFLGSIFMALFWIFLIILIIRALRGGRRHGPWMWTDWHGKDALDILKERYAKGEITKEQFHEMRKELE